MPELIEQKVLIGVDAYGRRVTMTRRKSYDGKVVWSISTDPASQRDDAQTLYGLTDANICDMVKAIDVIKR